MFMRHTRVALWCFILGAVLVMPNIPAVACKLAEPVPAEDQCAMRDVNIGKQGIYYDSGRFRGGLITDGADVKLIRWFSHEDFERIEISIFEWDGRNGGSALQRAPYFQLASTSYPGALDIEFFGVRAVTARQDFSALNKSFGESDLMHRLFPILMLDDSAYSLGIVFRAPVEFEVYELKNPGRIVIDMRKRQVRDPAMKIYSLRTHSGVPFGESADRWRLLAQEITGQSSRYLVDVHGDYLFEVGQYLCEMEAAVQHQRLLLEVPSLGWVVEQRGEGDVPQRFFDGQ